MGATGGATGAGTGFAAVERGVRYPLRSSANSFALPYPLFGSVSRHFMQTDSSDPGTSFRRVLGDAGGCPGGPPVKTSYRILPTARKSVAGART